MSPYNPPVVSIPGLKILSPFTIPSGIVTTRPSIIAGLARTVPELGFLTTKTLSVQPRAGYREPVLHEHWPGCFLNAVGLANPGARAFLREMKPLLPLPEGKPLVVSIMGGSPEEFLECALILDEIADAFELNLSCPHVQAAGQSVGSDPATVKRIVRLLKIHLSKPIIPKLSPNLLNVPEMAQVCEQAGADGLCLINTVGPGSAADDDGAPILWNVNGGLSGKGILPLGLKIVGEVSRVTKLPIIAAGGISSAADVVAYHRAGASYFSVGSSLAGKRTPEIRDAFSLLIAELKRPANERRHVIEQRTALLTAYRKLTVTSNTTIGDNMFKIVLNGAETCVPGRFYFLRIPGIGEKPFSPSSVEPLEFLVRTVGEFTKALEMARRGDGIFIRGPYGLGFREPQERKLLLIAGGTGVAPILMAARRWPEFMQGAFVGFSGNIEPSFRKELDTSLKPSHIVVDSPGMVGGMVRELEMQVGSPRLPLGASDVYLCGPGPMTHAVQTLLRGHIPMERVFLAREDIMRCGIGLCGSCATKHGLRSCVDGPVMSLGMEEHVQQEKDS